MFVITLWDIIAVLALALCMVLFVISAVVRLITQMGEKVAHKIWERDNAERSDLLT